MVLFNRSSIYWAATEADTQLAIFDSSASEKQLLVFISKLIKEVVVKGAFATVVVILVLSLAVWSAFYVLSEPLKSHDTKVVVGVIAGTVLFVKWIWRRVRRKEVKDDQTT